MNAYEEKRAARAERYRARAAAARVEADARFNSPANKILTGMMGEPVKVGHHSERRHRKLIEKAWSDMGKGCEAMDKAKHYESRADAAESNDAISSDDPDALAKLKEKLAELEASHARMKAVNAAYRAFKKNPASLDKSKLSEADKALVRTYEPPYSWHKAPYSDGYSLANSSANIKRVKERIVLLERNAGRAHEEVAGDGFVVVADPDENRILVKFPGKPDEAVRKGLKSHGFRWAPSRGAWSRFYRNNAAHWAEVVGAILKKGAN